MFSSAPQSLEGLVLNETDQQAILYLEKLRRKSPLPDDVIDLNPYQFKPYNLPGGIWYLTCSTEENRSEFGFWRQTGAATVIFANSAISVWRTTWEFIDIQDGQEQRTSWLSQEYKITEVGPQGTRMEKDARALCRVYDSAEAANFDGNYANSSVSTVPQRDTTYTKGSTSVVLVENGGDAKQLAAGADSHLEPLAISDLNPLLGDDYLEMDDLATPLSHSTTSDNPSRLTFPLVISGTDAKQLDSGPDKHLDPQRRDISGHNYIIDNDYIELDNLSVQLRNSATSVNSGGITLLLGSNGNDAKQLNSSQRRDISALNYIMDGDYLELDDLDDPLSLSTTSGNSRCSSFISDGYLEAMMQELNQSINSRIGAIVNPLEVVMPPNSSGSQVGAGEIQPIAEFTSSTLKTKNAEERDEDHTVKKLKAEQNNGDPSCSKDIASSSKNGRHMIKGKKKSSGVKMDGLKKYFCLMPFKIGD